jgi:hypothetical protein
VGWTVIFFVLLDWWAIRTAGERAVGSVGIIAGELERTAPTLVYFFVVGLLLGRMLGPRAGAAWAFSAAAAAMCVYAVLSRQVFSGGIDFLAAALLAIDYLLPPVLAVAGVATSRLWGNTASGAGPT